ncbi:rhodanese-like domain-containing protein [Fusibacter bizertensis]|uniref:thiosulfate sulfurtransferase n=1 Tax=Fusibacter bizertensis TaxID=1488331 RepID=A0ABT6NGJ6_9FIRM|nr:rhodanese-like domain-containing protein [Fusibacter bizertensis]MDH8679552.1 rhodanese-like domain-containing protein [Fusibacter bizertensis]
MTKRQLRILAMIVIMASLLALTACGIDTTYPGDLNVIEATAAIDALNANPKVIVIDARGEEAYNNGHLEGAICLSPLALVAESPIPMTLIDKTGFESIMSANGIANDSIVYIYDDNGGVNAGRIWWTMKVYGHDQVMLINGGASELVKAKGKLTADATKLSETSYNASEANTNMIATFDEVSTFAETPVEGVKLLDVRSAAEYAEGYIPGAILYPHTKNLYKDGTFMSSRDLGLFYKDAGFEKSDTIIVYCKSSFRATQTVALLQEAGYTNLKVYDGAWIEWSSKVDVSNMQEDTAPVGESDGS